MISKIGFYNVFLRCLSLASKFLLLLYLSKHFSVEDVGVYGLVSATILISTFIIGLDFYSFSTREVIVQKEFICKIIFNSFIFYLLIYLTSFPIFYFLLKIEIFPKKYFLLMIALIILEHMSTEFYRLLIALSSSVYANIVQFARSGSWVFAAIAICYYNSNDLKFVFATWICGALLSIFLAVIYFSRFDWSKHNWRDVDFNYMLRGVRLSSTFFISTIALKLIELSDRFFIQHFCGLQSLGVYTYYYNMANVIQAFVFTGVISIIYPKVIEAFSSGNYDRFLKLQQKMYKSVTISGLFLVLIASVLIKYVNSWTNHLVYNDNIFVFYIILGFVFVTIAGLTPHYSLYAMKKDRLIMISTVVPCLVGVLLNAFFIPLFGIYAAAFDSIVTIGLMGLFKYSFAKRELRANLYGSIQEKHVIVT